MRTKANDIYCKKGESFTIGYRLLGNNNAPYIISNQLERKQPESNGQESYLRKSYLLLTVASSDNITGSERYVANFWGDTSALPKFYSSKPIKIDNTDAGALWNSMFALCVDDAADQTPTSYGVYYTVDDYGNKTYYMLTGTSASDASLVEYDKKYYTYYKYFPKEITEQWNEQTYSYSIMLVSGNVVEDATSSNRPIDIDTAYPIVQAKIYIDSPIKGSLNN